MRKRRADPYRSALPHFPVRAPAQPSQRSRGNEGTATTGLGGTERGVVAPTVSQYRDEEPLLGSVDAAEPGFTDVSAAPPREGNHKPAPGAQTVQEQSVRMAPEVRR